MFVEDALENETSGAQLVLSVTMSDHHVGAAGGTMGGGALAKDVRAQVGWARGLEGREGCGAMCVGGLVQNDEGLAQPPGSSHLAEARGGLKEADGEEGEHHLGRRDVPVVQHGDG
jgi:hypothetical protein